MAFDAAWSAVNRDEQEEVSPIGMTWQHHWQGGMFIFFGVFCLFVFYMLLRIFFVRNGKLVKGAVFVGRYFVYICRKIVLMDR